jgi:hypothetical protein
MAEIPKITEREKETFTLLRRNQKGHFLRQSPSNHPKRGWKLMDAKLNPIHWIHADDLAVLVSKGYIKLDRISVMNNTDFYFKIFFQPSVYW